MADDLASQVKVEVECIDRMYLNLHQPRMQHELGVTGFFKLHRGFPLVSSAPIDPTSKTVSSLTPTDSWPSRVTTWSTDLA